MLTRRALLPLVVLLACSRSSNSNPATDAPAAHAPAAAPSPSGAEEASPAAPDADPAPVPAPESAVKEALEVRPGDPAAPAPLAANGETVIDPGASFRVVLAGTCRDARLLLLDAAGAAVPAAETSEVGTTTVLTLAPAAALTPGSRYQLRLDGSTGRELHLADRAYQPTRYLLRAAGDPPPAAKAVAKAKNTRSRHR